MDPKKKAIIEKVKAMFIHADSRLADKKFRENMPFWEKARLVGEMVSVARKIEIMNS